MAAKTDDGDKDHLLVGSVVKAMKVLEAYDGTRRVMGFSELARVTGLERSAAQRAAHTLWKLGYLEKTPGSGEYRLSIRCHDLGMRFLETQRMVDRAAPYISLLRRKTTASVNLTMLDGPDTVFIQRNPTVDSLGNRLGSLARIPAYCTATGIAMLSQLSRGAYALGPRIVELERKIQLSDPLLNSARPLMREHAQQFVDSVLLLCGLWGDRVLCLHQETGPASNGHPPIVQRARGIPFPLFRGAASLFILANLPLAKRRAIYLQHSKEIEKADLGSSWEEFRKATRALKEGKAVVTRGTFGSDLVAVAAPILDEDEAAFGSITRIVRQAEEGDIERMSDDITALALQAQIALGRELRRS